MSARSKKCAQTCQRNINFDDSSDFDDSELSATTDSDVDIDSEYSDLEFNAVINKAKITNSEPSGL